MEITYRRTIQVREYESITIEVKETAKTFTDTIENLEDMVDEELENHRQRLINAYKVSEFADDEDLG